MTKDSNSTWPGSGEPDRSTYPPAARGLPISNALAEAEPISIQDLFSRNPEAYSDSQIDVIVMHNRDLRVRLEQTGTSTTGRVASRARIKKDAFLPPGTMQSLLDGDLDE